MSWKSAAPEGAGGRGQRPASQIAPLPDSGDLRGSVDPR
jgi:hypothetical protein